MLLTRLPIARLLGPASTDAARCVWAYPIVGIVTGGLSGIVFSCCRSLGLQASVAAAWTLAASVLLTGALHEDGLADTADGLGGGSTPERRLQIMRDSRIGSFGALALVLSLGIRGAAIACFAGSGAAISALIVAGTLGRAAMIGVAWSLRPARADGLGASLAALPRFHATAGLLIAAAASCLLAPAMTPLAIVLTAVAAAAVAYAAASRIGGFTGDILGAAEQLAECAVLSALSRY